MQNKKNIPALRFRGFNEEWEVESFDKSFTGISNNTLSRDKLNYNIGKSKNIHYGDVLVRFNEILDIKNKEVPFITDDKISDKLKPSKLKNGDVVFADAAEDEMVGKCVEVTNITNEVVYSGLHTIAVRPKVEFAKGYLGYYLNSKLYHNQFLNLMQGTKVLSISKTAIKTTTVKFPNSKPEQTKIGSFFENLDQLLTKHQTQHQKLQALKKAMLGKLFPKKGATTPEIRFKGFTEDWEDEKLSFFADKSVDNRGKTPPLNKNGNHPLIEVDALGDGAPNYSKISKFLDDYSFNNFLRDYIKKGDILFSTVGSVGLVSLMDENESAAIAQNIVSFRPKEGFFPEYLYALFSNKLNKSLATKIVMNGVQPSIKVSQLVDVKYFITTNKEEQQQIGNYFKNLDALITKHATQIEKLGAIKKACLSKMFV
ncbi:restriction endonuclease subunit S [Tenacibaculum finnmarkense]|uniref:restriction endonuclease subunit S n=1 Tax=Tenacibaculum finnmarkense TaxID=2781243 RepID=UPI001EFB2DE7|nr:restriction endonuclease subunit S [Tenacibaculum finnmarkense]MCG8722631.1 restriction endonuclease subunit S [Tenacibaculum finnmarkense]